MYSQETVTICTQLPKGPTIFYRKWSKRASKQEIKNCKRGTPPPQGKIMTRVESVTQTLKVLPKVTVLLKGNTECTSFTPSAKFSNIPVTWKLNQNVNKSWLVATWHSPLSFLVILITGCSRAMRRHSSSTVMGSMVGVGAIPRQHSMIDRIMLLLSW